MSWNKEHAYYIWFWIFHCLVKSPMREQATTLWYYNDSFYRLIAFKRLGINKIYFSFENKTRRKSCLKTIKTCELSSSLLIWQMTLKICLTNTLFSIKKYMKFERYSEIIACPCLFNYTFVLIKTQQLMCQTDHTFLPFFFCIFYKKLKSKEKRKGASSNKWQLYLHSLVL